MVAAERRIEPPSLKKLRERRSRMWQLLWRLFRLCQHSLHQSAFACQEWQGRRRQGPRFMFCINRNYSVVVRYNSSNGGVLSFECTRVRATTTMRWWKRELQREKRKLWRGERTCLQVADRIARCYQVSEGTQKQRPYQVRTFANLRAFQQRQTNHVLYICTDLDGKPTCMLIGEATTDTRAKKNSRTQRL